MVKVRSNTEDCLHRAIELAEMAETALAEAANCLRETKRARYYPVPTARKSIAALKRAVAADIRAAEKRIAAMERKVAREVARS